MTSRRRTKVGLGLVVLSWAFVTGLGCSSSSPDEAPRERLELATQAIRATKSVQYEFIYEGYGSLNGNYFGEVKILKTDEPDETHIWTSLEIPDHSGDYSTSKTLTISTDGSEIVAVDRGRETYSYGTMTGGAGHLFSYASYGVLFQFIQLEPFRAELSEGPLHLVKTKRINGVECDIVKATNDTYGGAEVFWYLGVEDHLPRGQKWVVTTPGVEGGFWFSIRDLNVDCGLSPEDFELVQPAGYAAVDEDARRIEPGVEAPDWRLVSTHGESVRLSSLRGQVVVLDWWASWCHACWRLMPRFDRIARAYEGRGVVFYGVNAWESPGVDPDAYMQSKELTYPVLLAGERIAIDYKVGSLPALFVIDQEGRFVLTRSPVVEDPETIELALAEAIESTLAGSN